MYARQKGAVHASCEARVLEQEQNEHNNIANAKGREGMDMKKIIAIILTLALVFALASCGGNDAQGNTSQIDAYSFR